MLAYANLPPVSPAANATPAPPRVTRQMGLYLNQLLPPPNVAPAGVPGVSFGYSQSGNTALW